MKNLYLLFILFSFSQFIQSQEGVQFEENKQLYLKGNSILIGNNILGEQVTNPLMDLNIPNDLVKMTYIDVDDDKKTFSSSEATIIDAPQNKKIEYAVLYWCGLYPFKKGVLRKSGNKMIHVGRGDREEDIKSILLKTPKGNYEPIEGEIIYDSYNLPSFKTNKPYVCYADVTTKLQSLSTLN